MVIVDGCTMYYDTMRIICHFRDCKAFLDPRVGHIMKCPATYSYTTVYCGIHERSRECYPQ